MKPSNFSSSPQKRTAAQPATRPPSASALPPRITAGQTFSGQHRATPVQPSPAPAHRVAKPKSAPPVYRPPLPLTQAPVQAKLNRPSTQPFSAAVSQAAPPVYRPQTPAQAKPAAQKIVAPGTVHRLAPYVPGPKATVQAMLTRSKAKPAVAPVLGGVHSPPPKGFALVGKYTLMAQGVDTDAKIYQKTVTLADGKSGTLLWWEYPLYQIDDFVYNGDRQKDINDCNRKCEKEGYTWHHAGWPIDEQKGTMQLVPTDEHSVLGHVGGIVISKGGHVS